MKASFVTAETVRRQHVSKKEMLLHKRKVKGFCLFTVVIFCLALIYVWTRIKVVQFGYEVSRLTKEVRELTEQKSRLETEVAKLKSPELLETKARKDFHMRLPHGNEVVFVKP